MSQTQEENDSQILKLMANPLNLQGRLLDHLEANLLGGTGTIVDPNSPAVHLIEGFSAVTADYARGVQTALDRRLATRAQSMSDLYLHMSDYDYVGRFATPSKAVLQMGLDRNYVLQRGVLVNNSYRVVHIPADTEFSLGTLKFSIYYPIQIQVDERTKTPLVTYDLTKQNELRKMETNLVNFMQYHYLNYDLILLDIDIYQFEKTVREETLDSMMGFSTTYTFADQFYCVRLFTEKNGKEIELGVTHTEENYDPTRPTARVKVMSDTQKLWINIPQIYFSAGMLGPKLRIELYTTKGDITAAVGSLPEDQVRVDFKLDRKGSNPYTDCMRYNPTLFCTVTSPTTTEGTNGYSYDVMRERVIRDSYRTKVQITPMDIQNYYADYGIKVDRYEDNLTNLMYFVYKPFKNGNGQVVPSTNTFLRILPTTPEKTSSIKANPDGTITILPTTWFRYQDSADLADPLTDDELSYLGEMDKETLAQEFNSNEYIRTPFHIRLIKKDAYPVATSYNLMQPTVTDVVIDEDNPDALPQMLAVAETLTHERFGEGGYKLTLIIKKDQLDDIPLESQHIWLYTTSTDGHYIGIEAKQVGTVDDFFIYEAVLSTSYWINEKNEIEITSLRDFSSSLNYSINLESEFTIVYMVDGAYFPTISTEPHMYTGVPTTRFQNQVVLLRQSMKLHFGHALDDVIMNLINPTWEKKQYRRHLVDVPNTYPTNILDYDSQGLPILETGEDGQEHFKILHKKGDVVIGEDGEIEYKHRAGDLWLDTDGMPVILGGRIHEYQIQAAVFDGKLFISEHPLEKDFVKNLVADFEANFKIIREARGYVNERTMVYFRPAKSMGSAVFQTGNGVRLTMGLDLQLAFRFHVEPIVNTDSDLKATTREAAIKIVEPMLQNEIISQTNMAEKIKNEVYYIQSVDALGINGTKDLQTLTVVASSSQPSIRKKLTISEDNQIVLSEDLVLDYVDVR